MHTLKSFNRSLLDLAWSLWTELGIRGVQQRHSNTLIWVEELLLFSHVIMELDPRLRDEIADWRTQYNRFISISRLKSLFVKSQDIISITFSQIENIPQNIHLSRKSVLRPQSSAALLNIRARSIFGTGSRADLMTYFAVHPNTEFSIAELTEAIGYSKRNLTEVLNDLSQGQLLGMRMQGNQKRYSLRPSNSLLPALAPLPHYVPWHLVFHILLSLRMCLQKIDKMSSSTQVIELRNCFMKLQPNLDQLKVAPPEFSGDMADYLTSFYQWLDSFLSRFAADDGGRLA